MQNSNSKAQISPVSLPIGKPNVVRGLLLISLEDIIKDTRSLTRIVNIIHSKKFTSKDLIFNITRGKFDSYISIISRVKTPDKNNWTIYLFECDFAGINVKHLSGFNYTYLSKKEEVGKFIKSKKWVNEYLVERKIREIKMEVEIANSKLELLTTFCG